MSRTADAPLPCNLNTSLIAAARVVGILCFALLLTWGTLAVYWSNVPWFPVRVVLAAALAAGGLCAMFVANTNRWLWVFAGAFAIVVIWWVSMQPPSEGNWQQEFSVKPRVEVDGDRVRILGYRDFSYESLTTFTPRFNEREVSLNDLDTLDLFFSYWEPDGLMAHTFVSFGFRDQPPVCVSIEARREEGQCYSPLASCFKQYPLIYIVGSERDIVGVRTNHRNEQVFRYRVQAPPEVIQRFFLTYVDEINRLAERPRWYHLLRSNCTSNIVRHARSDLGAKRFDIRLLLNGYADRFAYDRGVLDTSVPFAELRRRARIDPVPTAINDPADFSAYIRGTFE